MSNHIPLFSVGDIRGVGLVRVSRGFPGIPAWDNYASQVEKIWNPTDLQYLANLAYGEEKAQEIEDLHSFATSSGPYSPFAYEAAITLGLAACDAVTDDLQLSGKTHFDMLKETEFDGASGRVTFHNVTGTRDPSGTLYMVQNYVVDEREDGLSFKPVITNLFQKQQWNKLEDYIFNDGTSSLPIDLAPPKAESEMPLAYILSGAGLIFAFLGFVYFIIRENKRKSNDAVWKVKKEDLKFSDPPEVLGEGTFGEVLLAEYRGTQVAVKRVIPPKEAKAKGSRSSNMFGSIFGSQMNSRSQTIMGSESAPHESGILSGILSGKGSWANMGGLVSGIGLRNNGDKSVGAATHKTTASLKDYKKLIEEFMEEMRYLSRLRHPNITCVMGAVIDKNEVPMLVMEVR